MAQIGMAHLSQLENGAVAARINAISAAIGSYTAPEPIPSETKRDLSVWNTLGLGGHLAHFGEAQQQHTSGFPRNTLLFGRNWSVLYRPKARTPVFLQEKGLPRSDFPQFQGSTTFLSSK
jgi:hypothetical protein